MIFIVGYLMIGTFLAGMSIGDLNFSQTDLKSTLRDMAFGMFIASIIITIWPFLILYAAIGDLLNEK